MTIAFSDLIKSLAVQVGDESIKPDVNGTCELFFDDIEVTMQFIESRNQVIFYSNIGKLPDADSEKLRLYSQLLQANFFFRATGGAATGVDEKTGIVSLQYLLSLQGVDSVEFLRVLELYLQMAEHWRTACKNINSKEEAIISPPKGTSGWIHA